LFAAALLFLRTRVLAPLRALLHGMHRRLGPWRRAVFGQVDWRAPPWARWTHAQARTGATRVVDYARSRPRHATVIVVTTIATVYCAHALAQWYENRPQPVRTSFVLRAPDATCFGCDPPTTPPPLIIEFAGSSAPIERSGHALDRNTPAIRLSPAIKGHWQWDGDRTLRFSPEGLWPIDQRYEVTLARTGLVAPHVLLDRYQIEFRTPKFAARASNPEFYEDPSVATAKKAVITLLFTDPVDVARFEKRISLRVYERIADKIEEDRGLAQFTVIYDKGNRVAHIHSNQLPVPAKGGRLAITIDKGLRSTRGGNETEEPLKQAVGIPGLYSLTAQDVSLRVVRDERDEPVEALFVGLNHTVLESELPLRVHAWRLPKEHPDPAVQKRYGQKLFPWSEQTASAEILAKAKPAALAHVAGDREHYELHTFRHDADAGEYLYVKVDRGLKSFGGYLLADSVERVMRVPDYPKELRLAHEGALLSLSGKKTVTVMTRGVEGIRVDIGRLLPRQIQHLITQSDGSFSHLTFNYGSFDADNITERFTKKIKLANVKPSTASYQALPLESYLADDANDRRGVFFLNVQAWDIEKDKPLDQPGYREDSEEYDADASRRSPYSDSRLVVITDLGMLAKQSIDGSQEVFVQSIRTGDPVPDVRVEVLGRNGVAVLSATTDAEGHVHFADLKSFKREQQPVLYLARRGGDLSFLPINDGQRKLDLSRFDVGGVSDRVERGALTAYLFSDRGLYRPGEEIRLGAILRSQDWKQSTTGIPLQLTVTDPRGVRIRNERFAPGPGGFGEIRHETRATSPAGSYTFALTVIRPDGPGPMIGSIAVQVRDFLPDRLRMSARFTAESATGWVSPDGLTVNVNLHNLFGAPAENRRIAGSMSLAPAAPYFAAFPDFNFRDPNVDRRGASEPVSATTDAQGEATIDLNLGRFDRALYQVYVNAEGFEADGGRAVSAAATQLVSSLPYLIGWKADGALSYVHRGSKQTAEIIAVGPSGQKVAATGLKVSRYELRAVSTLIRQSNGLYKYQSTTRTSLIDANDSDIPQDGSKLVLPTDVPGTFAYEISDGSGHVLTRIDYFVAGDANLARALDKNTLLQIALNREDYAAGDEIEMQIQAPYTGAGLITIERDRLYAWRWFKTKTTSSTQRIRVPAGIEGNAYVSVSFIRDPASDEIYTSPLSYGVKPFSIDLGSRRTPVKIDTPSLVKPGETLRFKYSTPKPTRIAIFAVDEGILQVAQYRTPNPLAKFFEKRALEVDTAQILDLILPELRQSGTDSAPGGDQESAIGRHLNPFQRKGEKPVTYWSGILDADGTEREVEYVVPDYFNGTLRVMAVAVSDEAIGVHESRTVSRGDFVLSPNAPTTVTPGDELEVGVGVSNQLEGSGAEAAIAVSLKADPALEILGPDTQTVTIPEKRENVVRFRLRVRDVLGGAVLEFSARSGNAAIRRRTDVSVRPATPYRTLLRAGTLKNDSTDVRVQRTMYPDHRTLSASVSLVPLSLAHGLTAYLGNYPYQCTEQLVSQAVPALALGDRPEFGYVRAQPGANLEGLINELRVRQNDEGAYRLWPGGNDVVEFVSVYAQHFLIDASEHGERLPGDVVQRGNEYLRQLARRDGDNLTDERNSAYAIYLLVRQGQIMSSEAAALHKRLTERYKKEWEQDLAALWLGAAYKLMRQDNEASRLVNRLQFGVDSRTDSYSDSMTRDAFLLYVLSKHFAHRLPAIPATAFEDLAKRLSDGTYHSLSAGSTLLALNEYVAATNATEAPLLGIATILRQDRKVVPLALPKVLMPRVSFGPDALALRFSSDSKFNGYYVVEESGFDRQPPIQAITRGMEIIRQYGDGKRNAVKVGDTVSVSLKVRSTDGQVHSDVALVDLFPGGFDLFVPPGGGSAAYGGAFADAREDRVVFYAHVSPGLTTLMYTLRATNVGTYVVPPAYGEAMYDRSIEARSVAGSISVVPQ
jgi:uncharacterized protein YfaS (alpha-2-macroglobulin family)